MKNAHLRMGVLEFREVVGTTTTHFRVRVDRYMGDKEQGLVLSLFGGDTEIGGISAALVNNAWFTLQFPDGSSHRIRMGDRVLCYRGAINISGRKTPVRHLLALAEPVQANGSDGKVYMLNFQPELAWHYLVSVLGLPATPGWGEWVVNRLRAKRRINELEGIGCDPVRINATRTLLGRWIKQGVRTGRLPFPEKNGPILWPAANMRGALARATDTNELDIAAVA